MSREQLRSDSNMNHSFLMNYAIVLNCLPFVKTSQECLTNCFKEDWIRMIKSEFSDKQMNAAYRSSRPSGVWSIPLHLGRLMQKLWVSVDVVIFQQMMFLFHSVSISMFSLCNTNNSFGEKNSLLHFRRNIQSHKFGISFQHSSKQFL